MNNPEFNTELKEWIEALENTILSDGKEYSKELLKALFTEASLKGIVLDELNDPSFKNTVQSDEELPYPVTGILKKKLDISFVGTAS